MKIGDFDAIISEWCSCTSGRLPSASQIRDLYGFLDLDRQHVLYELLRQDVYDIAEREEVDLSRVGEVFWEVAGETVGEWSPDWCEILEQAIEDGLTKEAEAKD